MTMDYVARFVETALDEQGDIATRDYLRLFGGAVARHVPPYFLADYGNSFRSHIENPVWVLQSLVSNAIKEGEGSRDLAKIANACTSAGLVDDLSQHVEDEAGHCRMYLRLADLVFPDALPDNVRGAVETQFPPMQHSQVEAASLETWRVLDYLIQVNLGEVRTRIHQKLLEPVLEAYCPHRNLDMLGRTLCKLSGDECSHIRYTARRIGELSKEFASTRVEELFWQRLLQFTAYTERELGSQRAGGFATSLVRDR